MGSEVVHDSTVQYIRLHYSIRRCMKMGQELQTVNHNNRLLEWSKRVEECRNSGQTVVEWCREHGIPTSTYFVWQRKVFKAVASRREVCFAEVPVIQPAQSSNTAVAAVQCGDICVKVYAGADTATLHAILQAVRLC